jgi:hypothetical protein
MRAPRGERPRSAVSTVVVFTWSLPSRAQPDVEHAVAATTGAQPSIERTRRTSRQIARSRAGALHAASPGRRSERPLKNATPPRAQPAPVGTSVLRPSPTSDRFFVSAARGAPGVTRHPERQSWVYERGSGDRRSKQTQHAFAVVLAANFAAKPGNTRRYELTPSGRRTPSEQAQRHQPTRSNTVRDRLLIRRSQVRVLPEAQESPGR